MNQEKPLKFYTDRYFKNFPNSKIEIIKRVEQYIYFETEFGLCKQEFNNFGRLGHNIESAINKTEYFINQANLVHNFKYDYSKVIYINNTTKITIICPIHEEFTQIPTSHLQKRGCFKCGQEKVGNNNSIKPSGWTLTNWEKSGKNSNRFDSFKVYIIKCWDENETFYKIGRTFTKVKERFASNYLMPYNYEIIEVYENTAEIIFNLETKLKNKNKQNKYLPKVKFKGMNECFLKLKK